MIVTAVFKQLTYQLVAKVMDLFAVSSVSGRFILRLPRVAPIKEEVEEVSRRSGRKGWINTGLKQLPCGIPSMLLLRGMLKVWECVSNLYSNKVRIWHVCCHSADPLNGRLAS